MLSSIMLSVEPSGLQVSGGPEEADRRTWAIGFLRNRTELGAVVMVVDSLEFV